MPPSVHDTLLRLLLGKKHGLTGMRFTCAATTAPVHWRGPTAEHGSRKI
jgi:hypothetical protein